MSDAQQPRQALVVYGSETGNAEDVAEEMGRLAVRLRFDTEVAELDAITLVCRAHDVMRCMLIACRNNYYSTMSCSLQSRLVVRVICLQTARSSGGLYEVQDCDPDAYNS